MSIPTSRSTSSPGDHVRVVIYERSDLIGTIRVWDEFGIEVLNDTQTTDWPRRVHRVPSVQIIDVFMEA